ncbi:transmembrane protein 254-like isoform X2 [Onychostoma macrolepis]|uniref:transmembrane protein 254-like isoform X2 n=1 Tax=Onychostoma macrolepis TaxID=369639 RepID=UPI002729FD1B|nr:transmembrane protein 254-like isoform X2 [Onychostoma macrolepis]
MAKSDGCSYFKRTSPFCMVVVTIYVCLHTWMAFWPQYIPYGILGPLGALAKRFMDYVHPALYYGWFLMLAIHVCEALLALKICRTVLVFVSAVIKALTARPRVCCGSLRRSCLVSRLWVIW